ncbi:hypothetical protein M2155_000633 [Streptomyces sp. SAI-119]|uniref:GIY-YIG nuclease family protein n=1 Tax=Streptomyces sp. SAI-119 TaxID=2940541 RepID=UPI002473BD9E|nr:GIY-YIG nuclease family protein [Streptomyces sp. SAI-119]MDH6448225.1 hypothetical protein [Streptomyces sp. SAI-119]
MSEPAKLAYNDDDFDCRPPIVSHTIDGNPTYAYRSPLPFDLRFRPVPKKAAAPKRNWDEGVKTYLIGIEGSHLTKIGRANNPKTRMETFQTGQPMTLSLLWVCEGNYEAKLHRRFADHRVRGEWFDLSAFGNPVEAVSSAVDEIKAAEAEAAAKL